jgi:hypothetical protein
MCSYMESLGENCLHPEGLRVATTSRFWCPSCGLHQDLDDIERWVRAAEKARDEAYPIVEGNGFGAVVLEELQGEVYRRRKVLYELRSAPPAVVARPELILVSYEAVDDAYKCRIFYKEPRPAYGLEWIRVEADLDPILTLRSHQDPNVRLASRKIEEFHDLRQRLIAQSTLPPSRRVFYQSEL